MIDATRPRRRLATGVLFAYAVAVALITVVPTHGHRAGRFHQPWWAMIEPVPFRVPLWSFALNVLMFLPLGALVPVVWRGFDSYKKVGFLALAASGTIEFTQWVFDVTLGSHRTVDINDLIANTAGGLLGLLAVRLVRLNEPVVTASGAGTPPSRRPPG